MLWCINLRLTGAVSKNNTYVSKGGEKPLEISARGGTRTHHRPLKIQYFQVPGVSKSLIEFLKLRIRVIFRCRRQHSSAGVLRGGRLPRFTRFTGQG
jgi:hypothetical protein